MLAGNSKSLHLFTAIIAVFLCLLPCRLRAAETTISVSPLPSETESTPTETKKVIHDKSLDTEFEAMSEHEPAGVEASTGLEASRIFPTIQEVPLSQGSKLGLRDCINLALLNNREIRAKGQDVEEANYKVSETKVLGLPVLDYEFLFGPAPRNVDDAVESFFSGNITLAERNKISLAIPLYAFGKLKFAQDLAKTGVEVEKNRKIEKENDVVLKIKQLYYGVLLAKDVEDLFEDADRHMESEIKRREESDEPSDPIDLVRLKLFRYEVLNRLIETRKKKLLAIEGLKIQTGLGLQQQFSLEDDHLTPMNYEIKEFQYYLDASQKRNTKTKLLDLGVKATEKAFDLEKRRIYPDIGFGGFYESGNTVQSISGLTLTDDYNDPFNYKRVGVGIRLRGDINIPRYRAKVGQAQAQYFKSVISQGIANEGIELDLKDSYYNLIHTRKAMENGYEAMKAARQFVFLTKSNIDIGVGDKKEYSDSLQAYLVSRGRYLESIYNYNIAIGTLESKISDHNSVQ